MQGFESQWTLSFTQSIVVSLKKENDMMWYLFFKDCYDHSVEMNLQVEI
jgi:hypothetical protein